MSVGPLVVPFGDVVGVAAFGRRPTTSTAAVSGDHGPVLVGGEGAGGPAEPERHAGVVEDEFLDVGVAGDAAGGVGRDAGAVGEVAFPDLVAAQGRGVGEDEHVGEVRAGGFAGEVGAGDLDERVGALLGGGAGVVGAVEFVVGAL